MAASLGRVEDGKQPKCLLIVDWLNKGTVIQWNILTPEKNENILYELI